MKGKAIICNLTFIAVFMLAVLLSSAAYAQLENPELPNREGVKVGDIIVHGAFNAREELETNIYLANQKEKFDAITVLHPSGGLEIPLRDNRISLDYDAEVYLYGRFHTENHIDQRARALAEINLTDYKITVDNVLRDYTDRSADENSRRIGRFSNKLRAGVSAEFHRLDFDVGYTNIIDTYSPKDDLLYQNLVTYGDRDRVYNVVDATVGYRFMPKTSIFMETDLGFIHYYHSSYPPDSWYIQPLIGLKGNPTNKILANIKGGFRYQGYQKSDVYNDKDFIGFVASGGLDFLMSDKDKIYFGIERGVYESLYQNMNYYNANIVALEYTHKFGRKVTSKLFASYQLNLYPGATVEGGVIDKRYDNFYDAGIDLRYDIRKWLSVGFMYDYSQRSSRFSTYDYIDNRIIFRGTGGF